MLDLDSVIYAAANGLGLVSDEEEKRKYDHFLMTTAPYTRVALEDLIREILDEINSQIKFHSVQLIYEDVELVVKVREVQAGFDWEDGEEVSALFLRVPPSLKEALQAQAQAEGFATLNAWAKQALPWLLKE